MLQERIRKWAEACDQNGYLNGTILLASNGRVLLNEGFGMANWEHQVPNTVATKYRIGSLTKAFTAMAIFQLHEKKKLHIDDTLDHYFPEYPNGECISLFHCLTNTSGIPNYTSFPDFWPRTMRLPSTLDQLIDSFRDRELEFKPGSRFGYSNSGYALLTSVIEAVSGMSYSEYIREHICLPAGMVHTGCDDGIRIVANLASGYSFYEEPIHAAYADLSFPLGAYGMYSTAEDLWLWDQVLRRPQLLNKDLMERMFRPNRGSYACGWMVSAVYGRACVHHFGDISGYCSDYLRFVDDDVTVIFLSNMNVTPVTHISREMARLVFGERVRVPLLGKPVQIVVQESILGKYAGDNEVHLILDISQKNNDYYLMTPKMYGVLYKFRLVPVSGDWSQTTYITEMIHEQLVFHYSVSGEMRDVEYTDYFGQNHTLHKVT